MNFYDQFTPDQLRAGYARNAAGLRAMLATAERTQRKVRGYTVAELRASVAVYEALSVATDAALRRHLESATMKVLGDYAGGGTA